MPKLKTKKSFAKRAKISKYGKFKVRRSCRSHILTKKSADRKRRLRKKGLIAGPNKKLARRLLPYG